jgi:hypothetical protein
MLKFDVLKNTILGKQKEVIKLINKLKNIKTMLIVLKK